MDFLYDDPCWDFDYWEYKIEEMRESDEWFGMDEWRAACLIQAWFRGLLARFHLEKLHGYATTIQRTWRGYRVRKWTSKLLEEARRRRHEEMLNRMAIRIQSLWRGYVCRKYNLDFYKLQDWLRFVCRKNEEIRLKMERYRENLLRKSERESEEESMKWVLFILFKTHHLLSTKHIPGVIKNSKRCKSLRIEEMIRCLKYLQYTRNKEKLKLAGSEQQCWLKSTYFERCEREIQEFKRSLQSDKVPVYRGQ